MRRRVIAGLCALALALVSGSGLALAGGWAVTSVDSAPEDVVAGTTYDIDYTILQHGEHPVEVDGSYIEITATTTGEQLRFDGQPVPGEPGRYSAAVTFPAAGAWEWRVSQGWFGMQELGSIQAQAAPASGSLWNSTALRVALPLAALAAFALLCLQTAWFWRERRAPAGRLQPAVSPVSSGD